jgi:hypothetical protein
MNEGLLATKDRIHIRMGKNKEILSACDEVFDPQHQDEARMIISEADYLREYLEEFSNLLLMGKPRFVVVTETGRQTTFRYNHKEGDAILLTRAQHGVEQLLRDSA